MFLYLIKMAAAETNLRNVNEVPHVESELDTTKWLQNNDPCLMALTFGWDTDGFVPHDDDWELAGAYVGKHTALEELCFMNMENVTTENLRLLCKGICRNKSIQHVSFLGCNLFGGKLFEYLIPFFMNNPKLDSVTLKGYNLEPKATHLLSTALQTSPSDITIELDTLEGGDVRAGETIASLFRDASTSYHFLGFRRSNIQSIGCIELANVLQRSPSCLTQLDLSNNIISDEGIVALSVALAENDWLKELHLSANTAITIIGWRALFTYLQSRYCLLQALSLDQVALDDTMAISFAKSLSRNHSLKRLDLSENPKVSSVGWRAISAVLQNQQCMLEVLDLKGNSLDETAVMDFATSLANNSSMKEFLINGNRKRITSKGLKAFSPVFDSPTSNLERIRFDPVPREAINDAATDLSDSLVNNKKLKYLIVLDKSTSPSDAAYIAFDQVLCDKSSISSTHLSNHTLRYLGCRVGNLGSCLGLNYNNHKELVARKKIMMVHFSGDCNIQPSSDMRYELYPHVLAWMAKYYSVNETNDSFSLLYQFMTRMPSFMDLNRARNSLVGGKRKRL
mmetsp:Transcript_11576/g.24691  ORF Transcript_11576/g.24691 Transcript_11576/m.24691 type:complete len:567 (-) Transcript_11576:286-1986(-)